jgi:predicted dehydrogenase
VSEKPGAQQENLDFCAAARKRFLSLMESWQQEMYLGGIHDDIRFAFWNHRLGLLGTENCAKSEELAPLHGKHVLVEKPLTPNVDEAEELVALAEEQQRVLMVGHTFEYSPAVNELRKLVQSGDLGKIYCIEAERVNLGLFRSDVNVIWDLAPHDLSILLYILGKSPEQIRVQAHAHLQPHIHDIAHLDLEFADGMTAHIHVSWLHPCKIRRVTVIGDARMAVYDDTNPAEMLKIYNKGADIRADPAVSYRFGEITIPHIDWIEPLRLECEDFANAIRLGVQPRANGRVGLAVVQVLAAVQQALEKQQTELKQGVK